MRPNLGGSVFATTIFEVSIAPYCQSSWQAGIRTVPHSGRKLVILCIGKRDGFLRFCDIQRLSSCDQNPVALPQSCIRHLTRILAFFPKGFARRGRRCRRSSDTRKHPRTPIRLRIPTASETIRPAMTLLQEVRRPNRRHSRRSERIQSGTPLCIQGKTYKLGQSYSILSPDRAPANDISLRFGWIFRAISYQLLAISFFPATSPPSQSPPPHSPPPPNSPTPPPPLHPQTTKIQSRRCTLENPA